MIGVTVTLVVEWYLFNNYINSKPFVGPTSTPVVDPFEIPKVSPILINIFKHIRWELNWKMYIVYFNFIFKYSITKKFINDNCRISSVEVRRARRFSSSTNKWNPLFKILLINQ